MFRILVVDDEPDILDTLHALLNDALRLPARIDLARDAPEAQRAIEDRGCYDMVLTDERMPGMAGSELLLWIGARCPSTVRALMTAYPASAIARPRANPHLFFPKPLHVEGMLRAMRSALQQAGAAPQ